MLRSLLVPALPTLLLGMVLYWPTLRVGLYADDYVALAIIDGVFAAPRSSLDLFNFVDGSAQDVRALLRYGSVPWWAPSDLRIAFMRPLSSALWHLDRALFGDDFVAYHAHSLLAWALSVLCAALVYRRLLHPVLWAFALWAFALDHSQHFPVLWLSNRGALYATAAGLLALQCHLRAREDGWRAGPPLTALFTCVGLLLGEWVFPLLAYILAYELVQPGRLRSRIAALWPAGLPALLFLIARAVQGYGARSSGAYVDPASEPLRFAGALLGRIPVFAADIFLNIPSAWWDHGSPWRDAVLGWNVVPPPLWRHAPSWQAVHVLIGSLALLASVLLVRWSLRDASAVERRTVAWLSLGALLSLVTVAGSFASTRLTLGAVFGLAPILMLVARRCLRALVATPMLAPTRWAARYCLVLGLAYLQLISPLRRDFPALVGDLRAVTGWVDSAQLGEHELTDQRVYLLNSLEFASAFYFAYTWHQLGHPLPRSVQPISLAPYPLRVTREDERTLIVHSLGGSLAVSGVERMFRSDPGGLEAGDRVDLDGATIEIVRVVQQAPRVLRLRFDEPVDDPSHVFLVSSREGLIRFSPPELGETTDVARATPPHWTTLRRARYERRFRPLPEFVLFDPVPQFIDYDPD